MRMLVNMINVETAHVYIRHCSIAYMEITECNTYRIDDAQQRVPDRILLVNGRVGVQQCLHHIFMPVARGKYQGSPAELQDRRRRRLRVRTGMGSLDHCARITAETMNAHRLDLIALVNCRVSP
jgi:hypothetical protein